MSELILSRRKLFIAGSTVLASVVGAPMIVRATSLMEINTLENRMVVVYGTKRSGVYVESGINAATSFDINFMRKWAALNRGALYSLRRRGEVTYKRTDKEKLSIYREAARSIDYYDRYTPGWELKHPGKLTRLLQG